jgi:RNA polymerase primary sigma factor
MLPARQREVIKLRFGFDGQPRTFKEVGDYLVIHWERIRKIEKDALNYLRYSARFNLLKDYLE